MSLTRVEARLSGTLSFDSEMLVPVGEADHIMVLAATGTLSDYLLENKDKAWVLDLLEQMGTNAVRLSVQVV